MIRHRADQVGSFLRPRELVHARAAHANGAITLDALRRAEDVANDDVLRQQQATGIDIFSDGEFRRAAFLGNFTSVVDGFETIPVSRSATAFFGANEPADQAVLAVTRRLQQTGRLAQVEVDYLRAHAPGAFKITLPTPFQFVNFVDGVTDQVYADRAE